MLRFNAQGMWNNTLLVFSSDNGGPIPGDPVGMDIGSSNWPLRGMPMHRDACRARVCVMQACVRICVCGVCVCVCVSARACACASVRAPVYAC